MTRSPSVLPASSGAFAQAVEAGAGDFLDVDILRRARDPWRCPAALLPFLAHQRSVDIWDETWPEEVKRSVIASAPADHRIKGTEAGLRRYLSIIGASLRQLAVPPQGFIAARSPSREEQNAYVRRLPELRLHVRRQRGSSQGFVAGRDAAGAAFTNPDRSSSLLQRQAILVRDGVETALRVVATTKGVERVALPGDAGAALVAGGSAAGAAFLDRPKRRSVIYTMNRAPLRLPDGALRLSAIRPGLDPVNANVEHTSVPLPAGRALVAGRAAAGAAHALGDRSEEMLFDRLRLFDPAVAGPLSGHGAIAGVSRVSMPAHRAEILVLNRNPGQRGSFIAGKGAAGRSSAVQTDLKRHRQTLEAVTLSKRHSDRILVSLETTRLRKLADGFNLSTGLRFGDRVARAL